MFWINHLLINFGIFIILSFLSLTNGTIYFCIPHQHNAQNQIGVTDVSSLIEEFKTNMEEIIKNETETSENNFHFNFTHPAITLAGDLLNVTLHLGHYDFKTFQFASVGFQLFNVTFPSVMVQGSNYTFDGHVGKDEGLFRLYGSNGSFMMNPINLSIALTVDLISNASGLCLPVHLGILMQDMKIRFDHNMGGDSFLEPLFNRLIGIIGSEGTGIIWDEVANYAAGPIQKIVNKWLHWNSTDKNDGFTRLVSWISTNKDELLSRKIQLN